MTTKDATQHSAESTLSADQDDQSIPSPEAELEKMKQKLTPKKPENKSVPGTEALQKSNFIKIAKRAKVWLNAMNEAAKV